MNPTSWHSYPKLYAIGHRALAALLLDDVTVEEKLDGSQFSFGVFRDSTLDTLDSVSEVYHNNCLGCVKATSPRYWNMVRKHFPIVFQRRCEQSRLLGVKLVRIKNVRHYLDELPPDADGPKEDIECGPVCQTPSEEPE